VGNRSRRQVSTVRALVIDDSRTMRSLLSRQLVALGYETLQAANGQEALDVMEQVGADVPDLATIDWNMPVMDGLSFVQRVRARPEWRSMSLMMVTTEAEYDQIVRALAAGAHEYLIKPFTPEAFADKLQLLGLLPERAAS
jgi:two-component system chemotaxis response regulator CheY